MATIRDVANYAGVSIATVSKYINGGNVLAENKVLIEEAIEKLNYQVNIMARGLKTNKTMTIGILIPSLTNLFFTTIIASLESIIQTEGYSTIISNYQEDVDLEREKLEFLATRNVDGIIMVPSGQGNLDLITKLNKDTPIILIDRNIEGAQLDAVLTDNINGSYTAVEKFIAKGHRRIGVICGPKEHYTAEERLVGYERVHRDYKLKIDPELIKFGDYQLEGGHRALTQLLDLEVPPTAIFVTNYEMTLGAVIALNEMGVSIPQDVSIIGYDNLELAKLVKPPLSMVIQPMEAIGKTAAQLLLQRLNGDRSGFPSLHRLESELMIKDSIKRID